MAKRSCHPEVPCRTPNSPAITTSSEPRNSFVALRKDGVVVAWGNTEVSDLRDVVEVSASSGAPCLALF